MPILCGISFKLVQTINIDQGSHAEVLNNRQDKWAFKFHNVLHNANQENVYGTVAGDIVHSAIEGVNGTVFAYGQTGAGKTFTMIGDTKNFKQRGIAPRALGQVGVCETSSARLLTVA